jgi:hypothetical protein
MSPAVRKRNERLLAVIKACGWSYAECANAIRAVAKESGKDLSSLHRSHVFHWISGVRPSGSTPEYLAEAASRRLRRHVALVELGLDPSAHDQPPSADLDLDRDPVADLVTVGRADLERLLCVTRDEDVEAGRRRWR